MFHLIEGEIPYMIIILVKTKFQTLVERDRMVAALMKVAEPTRAEPGVVEYRCAVDPQDPLLLHGYEIYASEEAILSHNSSDHMTALIAEVSDVNAQISLKAYRGDLEPYDLNQLVDHDATFAGEPGGGGMVFSLS
jgi:quinol monooxygenase YgiN